MCSIPGVSTFRSFETWICTIFCALSGTSSPQRSSTIRSIASVRLAFTTRSASNARCFPPGSRTSRSSSRTSSGPRIRKFIRAPSGRPYHGERASFTGRQPRSSRPTAAFQSPPAQTPVATRKETEDDEHATHDCGPRPPPPQACVVPPLPGGSAERAARGVPLRRGDARPERAWTRPTSWRSSTRGRSRTPTGRSCTRRRCRTSATSSTTSAGTAARPHATGPTART